MSQISRFVIPEKKRNSSGVTVCKSCTFFKLLFVIFKLGQLLKIRKYIKWAGIKFCFKLHSVFRVCLLFLQFISPPAFSCRAFYYLYYYLYLYYCLIWWIEFFLVESKRQTLYLELCIKVIDISNIWLRTSLSTGFYTDFLFSDSRDT